jgi:hypothetical protein
MNYSQKQRSRDSTEPFILRKVEEMTIHNELLSQENSKLKRNLRDFQQKFQSQLKEIKEKMKENELLKRDIQNLSQFQQLHFSQQQENQDLKNKLSNQENENVLLNHFVQKVQNILKLDNFHTITPLQERIRVLNFQIEELKNRNEELEQSFKNQMEISLQLIPNLNIDSQTSMQKKKQDHHNSQAPNQENVKEQHIERKNSFNILNDSSTSKFHHFPSDKENKSHQSNSRNQPNTKGKTNEEKFPNAFNNSSSSKSFHFPNDEENKSHQSYSKNKTNEEDFSNKFHDSSSSIHSNRPNDEGNKSHQSYSRNKTNEEEFPNKFHNSSIPKQLNPTNGEENKSHQSNSRNKTNEQDFSNKFPGSSSTLKQSDPPRDEGNKSHQSYSKNKTTLNKKSN